MREIIENSRERRGIAMMLVVVAVVVIILIAGVGIFLAVGNTSKSTTQTTTSSHTTTPVTTTLSSTFATTSKSSSTSASGITRYNGTFSYTLHLGPFGERVLPNNTVQNYSSVQVASGSFTFFISALNQSGSGSGHGTLTVTTSGFCTGTVTVPYTFQIPDATTLLQNLTVFFGGPSPVNFTVPLVCTGPMTGVNGVNNPSPYLADYPGEFSLSTMPANVTQTLSGGTVYSYTVTKMS